MRSVAALLLIAPLALPLLTAVTVTTATLAVSNSSSNYSVVFDLPGSFRSIQLFAAVLAHVPPGSPAVIVTKTSPKGDEYTDIVAYWANATEAWRHTIFNFGSPAGAAFMDVAVADRPNGGHHREALVVECADILCYSATVLTGEPQRTFNSAKASSTAAPLPWLPPAVPEPALILGTSDATDMGVVEARAVADGRLLVKVNVPNQAVGTMALSCNGTAVYVVGWNSYNGKSGIAAVDLVAGTSLLSRSR
jgi:hypothetical protein